MWEGRNCTGLGELEWERKRFKENVFECFLNIHLFLNKKCFLKKTLDLSNDSTFIIYLFKFIYS